MIPISGNEELEPKNNCAKTEELKQDVAEVKAEETPVPDASGIKAEETPVPDASGIKAEETPVPDVSAVKAEEISEREADQTEEETEPKAEEYYAAFRDEYDIEHPGLPGPVCRYLPKQGISAFAVTQKGQSHKKNKTACQDRSGLKVLDDRGIVLAAVADGVGSCALSDLGADCAVRSSLDRMEAEIKACDVLDVSRAAAILRSAMSAAYDAVEQMASEMVINSYSFQSTLTITIYDGKNLYIGHAGDDGVVALFENGGYYMVTVRHKGEEASSVYPLQSKSTWQFSKSENVIGYVLCTDGVLDSFVRSEFESNRIYFPFIERDFTKPAASSEDVERACAAKEKMLLSESYRARVTDDLTYVAVVNNYALVNSLEKPAFDKRKWDADTDVYRKKREELLKAGNHFAGAEQKRTDNTTASQPQVRAGNHDSVRARGNETGGLPQGQYKPGYERSPSDTGKTAAWPNDGQPWLFKNRTAAGKKIRDGTIMWIHAAELFSEGVIEMILPNDSEDSENRRR